VALGKYGQVLVCARLRGKAILRGVDIVRRGLSDPVEAYSRSGGKLITALGSVGVKSLMTLYTEIEISGSRSPRSGTLP
jgi:hypothetical protein